MLASPAQCEIRGNSEFSISVYRLAVHPADIQNRTVIMFYPPDSKKVGRFSLHVDGCFTPSPGLAWEQLQ